MKREDNCASRFNWHSRSHPVVAVRNTLLCHNDYTKKAIKACWIFNIHRRELDVGIIVGFAERVRQREATAHRHDENPASSVHRWQHRGGVRLTKSQKSRSRRHFIRYHGATCRRSTPCDNAATSAHSLPSSQSRPSKKLVVTRRMESKLMIARQISEWMRFSRSSVDHVDEYLQGREISSLEKRSSNALKKHCFLWVSPQVQTQSAKILKNKC